jgi:hypothetical protein
MGTLTYIKMEHGIRRYYSVPTYCISVFQVTIHLMYRFLEYIEMCIKYKLNNKYYKNY